MTIFVSSGALLFIKVPINGLISEEPENPLLSLYRRAKIFSSTMDFSYLFEVEVLGIVDFVRAVSAAFLLQMGDIYLQHVYCRYKIRLHLLLREELFPLLSCPLPGVALYFRYPFHDFGAFGTCKHCVRDSCVFSRAA